MNLEQIDQFSTEEIVGRKLRSIRLSQGLSLRALAARSGLNINTLVLIEKAKSSPSVSTLQQISQALGVPITSFFESEPVEKQVVFTQANNRPGASIGSTLMQNLGKDLQDNAVQPFVVTLKPGVASGDSPAVHTGHEFVYCLSGTVKCRVVEDEFSLQQGDSLLFHAHLPHCWRNNSTEPSQMLLIFFPSEKGEEPGGRHFSLESRKQEMNMKIAVISDDGKSISQHFGRAPFYVVFDIQNGKITNREIREKMGHNQFSSQHGSDVIEPHDHSQGHGLDAASHDKHIGMAQVISDCEALICGGMGMGAYESMRRLNIKPIVTETIEAEAAVLAYIDGKLIDQTEKLH